MINFEPFLMISLQSDDLKKRDIQNGGRMDIMTQLSCEYDVITSCCSHLERNVVKRTIYHVTFIVIAWIFLKL